MLDCLVDADSFDEYKAEYGQSLVCGTARLGGFPVGIVANQHHRVRPADGPIQFGGVLYVDSAEKAARFVMNCNQDWLPIVFLQDVNGFMVGRDSERDGIIKAGAKLVNAISNSRVPKLTVIRRRLVRRGQLRDVRQGLRSAVDLRLAHRPLRRDGGRAGHQHAAGHHGQKPRAAGTRRRRRGAGRAARQGQGETTTGQMDVRYGAARGWVDAILDPAETREELILSLEIVTRHAEDEPYRLGVFQV